MEIDERKKEIFKLCVDYIRSYKRQKTTDNREIKALLTTKLFAIGISRDIIYRIIMNLQNITTKKDLYKFLSNYHLLGEDVKTKKTKYFIKLSMPYSTKQTLKSDIRAMVNYFSDKGVSIKKYKIENNTVTVGEEIPPNKVLNVDVKIVAIATLNRYSLLQCVEPRYLLIKLKEIK